MTDRLDENTLRPRPRKLRVTTRAECGAPIKAEAWRDPAAKFHEVYVQVHDAAGNWATLRVLVPR